MTVDFNSYTPHKPIHPGLLNEMPRKLARESFKELMAVRSHRVEQLAELLKANELVLESNDQGLIELENWYRREVQADSDNPMRLQSRWYGVTFDIGIFLGETMISRAADLEWTFFTWGAKNAAYQRPVLMAPNNSPYPKYNVDPDSVVAMVGHRCVQGSPVEENRFLKMVRGVVDEITDPEHATRRIYVEHQSAKLSSGDN